MYHEIILQPKSILTRWGTWLEAVEYYTNVLLALHTENAASILRKPLPVT